MFQVCYFVLLLLSSNNLLLGGALRHTPVATLKRGGVSKSNPNRSESDKENMQHINIGSAEGQSVTVMEEHYESDDSDCIIVTPLPADSVPVVPPPCTPKSERPETPPIPSQSDLTSPATPAEIIPFAALVIDESATFQKDAQTAKISPTSPVVPPEPVSDGKSCYDLTFY